MSITVGGPVFEINGTQGPKFDDLKIMARQGDVRATVLVSTEILYGMLANFDERLENLTELVEQLGKRLDDVKEVSID